MPQVVPSTVGPRCQPASGSAITPAISILVLALALALGGPAALPAPPGIPRIDSLRLASPTAILVEGRIPADSYAILEQASGTDWTFAPVHILLPTEPGVVRTALPMARTTTPAAVFRLRTELVDEPADTDGDGMDDMYEVQRSHVLDPLDPSDGRRDADRDGDSNLTEYLSRTESAPPPLDAPVHYASLDELRKSAPTPLPPMVHLGGYNRDGDGWGGWFAWREDDPRTIDNALIVGFRSVGRGRLERIVEADAPVLTAWWQPSTDPDVDAGPALQHAFDYLATRPIRRLIFHPGRYQVRARIAYSDPDSSPLRLVGLDDFEIDGNGATIWSASDGELLMLKDCHRGTIRNLAVQGSGSDRGLTDGNYTSIGLVGAQSDLLFHRCAVRGFMHGISHLHGEKTSVRVTIRECWFEDGSDFAHGTLGGDGAAISGIGDDWLVENCYFHECGRGVEVENTSKLSPITRVIVRGNRMTQVRNIGVMAFLGGPAAGPLQQSDILIRDNLIVGRNPRHVDPHGDVVPIMNIAINGGSRWVVQGNICENGDFAGISLYANQAPLEDSLISGNVVTDMGGRGIQVYAISTLHVRGVLVSDNRIKDCSGPGILLSGEHLCAQGNVIENTAIGIALGDPSEPTLIARQLIARGNTIRSPSAGLPAIRIAPAAFGTSVADNDIIDALIGIRDESGTAILQGNRFQEVALEIESVLGTMTP